MSKKKKKLEKLKWFTCKFVDENSEIVKIYSGVGFNSRKNQYECIIPWNQIQIAKEIHLIESEKNIKEIRKLKKECLKIGLNKLKLSSKRVIC